MNTLERWLRGMTAAFFAALITLALLIFAASLVAAATLGASVWALWRLVTGQRPVLGLPGTLIRQAWAWRRGGHRFGPTPAPDPESVVDIDARFVPERHENLR